MPNYIPYLILVLISLTLLIVMMVRERRFGIIVLVFSYAGMVYVAEYFVFIIGDSYEYFPEVLSIRYYDNAAGAVVSNFLIVPTLATMIALYKLRWGWSILITMSFAGVEWLFIQLQIYEPHWWTIAYSVCLFFCFFYLARFWLGQLSKGLGFFRFISLWMQAWSGVGTVMFMMSVLGIRYYHLGVYEDIYRDDLFLGSMMGILKSGVFAIFVTCFKQVKWRLLAPPLVFALDIPLYAMGLLRVQIPFWQYTIIYAVMACLLLWWNSYAHRFLWGMGAGKLLEGQER